MKIKLLVFSLLVSVLSWGQTVSYTAMTTITCPATPTATISPAVSGLTFSQISRGAGVTCATAGGSISGSGFNGTLAANVTASKWYTYDVTSDATVSFSVTSLAIVSRVSSATGSPSVSVQYSINGGAKTVIGSYTPTTTATTYTITPGTAISVGANQTLNIFIIPNTLTAAGTTCRVENNSSITLTTTPTSSNTITTNTALVGSPFCVSGSTGASVSVPFTSVGTFNAGNVYTAQLSNAAGSFASPVSIGTVTSTLNTDVILATIPAGTAAGVGYRIRVVSSNPVVTGSDNTVNLTVNNAITITVQPPNRVITDGNNTTFTVTATGTTPTYQWQVDTTGTGTSFVDLTNGAPYSTVTTNTLNITAAPITFNGYLYRCVVSGAAPCGSVTSNSGSLTVSLTPPNNPTTIVPCYGNNTLGLSWTASSGGSAPDGYMVFALAGATTPAATAVAAGNSSLYAANANFTLASVVTASLGKCLYIGTGTSFTVTGLTNLSNYSFKVVAYRGTTATAWSTGVNTTGSWNTPATNIVIDIPEVTALAASIASGQSALTWTRPTPLACYDEYLVVANQGAVVFTPSGDGTAYTANSVYSGANQVVYKGTGAGVTVTGLTNGTNYCYKVFVRRGTEWSDGVSVCQTPNLLYCTSGATSSLDSEIENVTLVGYSTTISNNTTNVCTTGVNNYTAMSADLQVGGAYSVAVEFGDCSDGSQFDGAGGVWIDWNNDGDFLDVNETIGTALVAVSAGNVIQNFTINVPGGQPLGNYRMRIVQTEAATLGTLNPCGTFTYGSTEDYTVQVVSACVPTHTVTTFTPTSGPVGTEVTINGTGLTSAIVTFSGINATIVSNTGTQMVVVIPAGATTGLLSVKDSQPCAVDNIYTIITNNNTSCEGAAVTTDLIIYDIHDEQTGSGGFITLYNGTAAAVNLTNYSLWRTSTHDDGNEVVYGTLTGTIASGALGILKVSVGSCGPASTNGTITGGFNENDGIQLRDAAGAVIIDDVDTYPVGPGYYMVRNTGALSARTSYVAADWSTIPLGPGVCFPSAGLIPPSGGAVPPLVTTQPFYSPSCGSTSAVLNTAGTEGFAGGNTLAYQWFFAAPGSATWTAVTDGGIYSGATTASLSISVITGVINYQYYCQIRENLATCYSATSAIKITDTSASTWNGTSWIGGTPTITKAAIIDGTYVTATNGNFSCCSLTVNATKSLTISIGGYVEVQNNITNNGSFSVLSDGSLVQISDSGVNTGAISYNRTANIRRQDYVYWSSPVTGFSSSAISTGTNLTYQYKWLPTTGGINNFGNWSNANETMELGKGYIVRGPDSFTNALANYTATFTGVPNNGIVSIPISRGTWNGGTYATGVSTTLGTNEDDNWNLVGNPYPSAIHAINFLALNTNIDGFVNIWTHGTLPSTAIADPFYNDYAYNYTPGDYITYNASGTSSGPGVFNGRIAGGQGFFVSMLHSSAATTENLLFNNSLRNISYNNSQFFRTSNSTPNFVDLERNRIWFDLVSPTGNSTRSMLGYIENATNEKDRLFDAFSNEKLSFNIFSLIGNDKMLIQGKRLPFDVNDRVNIGVSIPQDGLYKIAISSVDGLFSSENQKIYLEDKLLNVIYDLRTAPYSFMGSKGTITDRFVIRYTNGLVLTSENFDIADEIVVISNQELSVVSSKEKITNIILFDVLGRKLFEVKDVNTNSYILPVNKRNAPLLMEITLENGQKRNKKTVF
jgi:hypothetical protein